MNFPRPSPGPAVSRAVLPRFLAGLRLALLGLAALPGMAVGTKYIFWTNHGTGTLARGVLNDQSNPPSVSAVEDPWIRPQGAVEGNAVVVFRDWVYWVDSGAEVLRRAWVNQAADTTGTQAYTFNTPALSGLFGLSVDAGAGYLFLPQATGDTLSAVEIATGTVTTVLNTGAHATGAPTAIRVDAPNRVIYWATDQEEVFSSTYNFSGANGAPAAQTTTFLVGSDSLVWDFALADGSLFVTSVGTATITGGINRRDATAWPMLDTGGAELTAVTAIRPVGNAHFVFGADQALKTLPRAGGAVPATFFDTGYNVGGIGITLDSTAVTLASFTARPAGGGVALAWATGSEVDAAGFHVLRAPAAEGPYARVDAQLIPARGSGAGGASYAWLDRMAEPGRTWFYKLEDVDVRGVRVLHGPASAVAGPAVFTLDDLEGLARAWGRREGDASFDPLFDLDGDGAVGDPDARLCLAAM